MTKSFPLPPSWGTDLSQIDYTTLAASWISREIADAAMLRRVDDQEGAQVIGQRGHRNCSGVLIPYYWPGDECPITYRLRRDKPEMVQSASGKLKQDRKYLGPAGSQNRLYVPIGITLADLANPDIPIAFVEGEKKALALLRLARTGTDLRFIPIAISGVWNWRGIIGKTNGPKGERLDVKGPITDLDRIAWEGRTVFIVFDSNVHSNNSVGAARSSFSRELTKRAASVKLVNIPQDCGVNGVDDLLALWGPERVLELFEATTPGTSLTIVKSPQFDYTPEGMFRITGQGEKLSKSRLTNFTAKITTNIEIDDGVEQSRELEIETELFSQVRRFTIPASEFASMDWPIERLGSSAIVFPSHRGYAQIAIQSNSLTAIEKHIYTHTGWRMVNGCWVYLHNGGATGLGGSVPDIEVRLPGAVGKFELRNSQDPDAIRAAVRASLKLLDLAPPAVSFPLYAALPRSIFGNADFSIHLVGESGAFKSELAALHQQHLGSEMNRQSLPGAWSSTGNALEALAFHAKDALIVIDDFAPQGALADVNRLHAAAERIFRAAGNHSGRTRLDSAAKLRLAKPPRALVLSTGEDIPRGQSLRARILVLELARGDIAIPNLTACQNDAQTGLYSLAMGGFVQWFAGRYESGQAAFKLKFVEYRTKARSSEAHARTPEIVANLQAAFELYMEFCVSTGAITASQADELIDRCWDALSRAAAAQTTHQVETEPTVRFLTLLRSILSSGRAHLQRSSWGEPAEVTESCGWRCDASGQWRAQGDCIGWLDGDRLYLDSSAAYRAVQVAARDSSEPFSISEQILKKRLNEKGLLDAVDKSRETLTVRRRIGGSNKDVLQFSRQTILRDADDDLPEEAA